MYGCDEGPDGLLLRGYIQLGQASVFTRQECGWLSVAPGNHTEGPGALHPDMSCGLPAAPRTRRASEYLASQRVEGEVRERQSTSLADRDPNPGEGHSNPLQYSCLENPMDREAWWATVYGLQRVNHD